MSLRTVVIGIQARSLSTRLPNKIHLLVGGKTILQTIIDICHAAMKYTQKDSMRLNANVKLCLLVPKGDPAIIIYRNQIETYEGDEQDVLSRYVEAQKAFNADYVVRITSDCYHHQSHLIAKHIKSALIKERDYTTNCLIRTFKEGLDTQVFSSRLLNWIDKNAKTTFHREHVGTILDGLKPRDFPFKDADGKPSVCHVLNNFDESEYKTSIDTKEDYEKSKSIEEKFRKSKDVARRAGIFVT